MRSTLPMFIGLVLTACTHTNSSLYVPPEEAAWFKFPYELPDTGNQTVPGAMAVAIQLAMDDFLPRDTKPERDTSPQDVCLQQRQSYDVKAAPGSADIIWVDISLSSGACTRGPGPLLDIGATYAIDKAQWRILAVRSLQ
ncbi:hypothetical protein [Hyalangium versicolor]|uniref:hypothetical protein n=1 Tax=Hyalangium versicolor TaxID=2861190 RepID=UPI001CCA05D9|nr:hypothetical protein [Hyalangium versicolor]